jgi:hemolysin D
MVHYGLRPNAPYALRAFVPVRVKLTRSAIMIYGNMVNLSAGLSAQAEIRTGQRRVIAFLRLPLAKRVDEAGRER